MALSDLRLKKITQGKGPYLDGNELPGGYGLSARISDKRKVFFQFRYRVKDLSTGKLILLYPYFSNHNYG